MKKKGNLINRRDQKHPPSYIVLCHPARERDKQSTPSEISRALPSYTPNSHPFSSYFPLFQFSSLILHSLMATSLYSTHCRSLATSSSSSASFQPSPFSSNPAYLQRVTFSHRFLASKVSLKSQPPSYKIPVHTQQQEGSSSSFSSSCTLLFVSFKF